MNAAEVSAPAKVNLRLRVFARRADGFHDLDTIFQAIDLADHVSVERRDAGLLLDVLGADLGPDEDNLAYRAAARLCAGVGYREGLEIRLDKRIPAGAGLGGGSSDAAGVLRCVARLLGIAEDDATVGRVAAELGSDVPFFLCGSPLARGTGRGEVLEPFAPLPPAALVLVSPPVHVSTAAAYRALSASRHGQGTGREPPPSRPRDWAEVRAMAKNDFEPVISREHDPVRRALAALESTQASFVLMSGSGSSVFGHFADQAAAERTAASLSVTLGWPCRVVRTLQAMPEPRVS